MSGDDQYSNRASSGGSDFACLGLRSLGAGQGFCGDQFFPMKASSIIKILTCLLCLFIVGAALDSLPDPPAIKPLSIQKNSTFQLAHIPVSTSAKPGFDCFSYRLQLHVNFISAIQSL